MGREFRRGESHKFDGASAHRKTNCRLYAQMQGACPPIRFFASEARSQGRPLANAGLSLSLMLLLIGAVVKCIRS